MEGGTVSGDQSECGAFDPGPITNVELPPADNNGRAIEYIWLSSTTTCDLRPCRSKTRVGWKIPDSNSPSFDPGPVTESTCFIRCARYEGCVDYLGESNVIAITVNPVVNLEATVTDAACNGDATGAIGLTVNGGTAPFTYAWSNNEDTEDIDNLTAGSYTVTVTDANGCTAELTKTVNEPAAIDISATVVDADCEGNTTGSIDLAVTGGTAPYSYSWDNGETTQDISGLAEGTYEVTVTDANNCTAVEQFDVGALPALMEGGTVSGDQSECGAFDPGPITNVELPPADNNGRAIEYIWLSSTTTCDPPVQGQTTGWVEIPDSNSPSFDPGPVTESTCFIRCARYEGCVDYLGESNVIAITVNPVVNLEATVTDAACNGDATGAIDLTVNGGTAPFTYAWSNNEDTEDIANLMAAGSYTVTVTDANGCTAELTKTVERAAELQLPTTSAQTSCTDADCERKSPRPHRRYRSGTVTGRHSPVQLQLETATGRPKIRI